MSYDDNVKQAIAHVVALSRFTVKKMATSDDLKTRTLTITLERVSDGWVQERMEFEDVGPAQVATVDGQGHVEKVVTLQPGDLAETAAEAEQEIAAAADPDEGTETTATPLHIEPDGVVAAGEDGLDDEPRDKDQPLVGELAATAKRRR